MLGVSGDREELILKDVFRVQFRVFRRGCNNTNDQTSISSLELEDIQEVINGVKKTILETDVSSQARKDLVHRLIRLRIKKEDLENRKYFQVKLVNDWVYNKCLIFSCQENKNVLDTAWFLVTRYLQLEESSSVENVEELCGT